VEQYQKFQQSISRSLSKFQKDLNCSLQEAVLLIARPIKAKAKTKTKVLSTPLLALPALPLALPAPPSLLALLAPEPCVDYVVSAEPLILLSAEEMANTPAGHYRAPPSLQVTGSAPLKGQIAAEFSANPPVNQGVCFLFFPAVRLLCMYPPPLP
jgi:hypothetical protein